MKKFLFLFLFICCSSFGQKIIYREYNSFLSKYVSITGNVNYDEIYLNKTELENVITFFEKNIPTEKATKEEKLVYWINSYNIHTIKLVIENYPVNAINEVKDCWKINFINYKGITISLDYVENEILRKLNEPRIHFAINSASISSPIISNEAFESSTVDKQLTNATRFFINDATKNQIATEKATLSKVFDWYKTDFTSSETIIDFVNKYSLTKLTPTAVVEYNEFNFGLNK